jgi:hypothetical protein
MKNLQTKHQQNLLETAESLIQQGFSVIPVHGNNNPNQPKKPATQWAKYQKRLAKPYEISSWFSKNITAIGIICGQISKLMVIDFDDHLTYKHFCTDHPLYADTFTVKTRRGYHLYFEINQYIPSHHFDGGDIKAEKSYVVASPSIINNHQYKIINFNVHQTLFPFQINEILNYFQINTKRHQTYLPNHPRKNVDLISIYNTLVTQLGRNNALYRTASIARDQSIDIFQAEEQLIYHHVKQPAPHNHKQEIPQERFNEAKRTINSAFNTLQKIHAPVVGIPNTIREQLLKRSTAFARFLDILRLEKWKPNDLFTMSDAIYICKNYGLNRKSVMKVLTGELSTWDDEYIIVRRHVEYPDIRGLKSYGRGRPTRFIFEVPSVSHLLKVLNLNWSPSDIITANDVKSAHGYRLALHREFIKRVTPQIPLWWLAQRIGVDVRTIQRYNLELDIQITQNLGCFTLSKSNLDTLPKRHRKISKNATNGFWLETEDGRRYPAWRHIGTELLKSHPKSIIVYIQKPSKLSLCDTFDEANSVVLHPMTPSHFVKLQAFRACVDDRPKIGQVVDNLMHHVKKRVNQVRYLSLRLHFDSVVNRIAKDDVAETITSYLYAFDEDGNRVHRPAKRGIAYRMLKEFGDGNVYLALLDLHAETWYALARHAVKFNQPAAAMRFLLSALD